jgi:hypothetical protein
MSSEPKTTSSTFGVTDGFCGAFREEAGVAPLTEPASGAIDVQLTRQMVVHMLVRSRCDALRLEIPSAKRDANARASKQLGGDFIISCNTSQSPTCCFLAHTSGDDLDVIRDSHQL